MANSRRRSSRANGLLSLRASQARADRQLDGAQALREGKLLLVREILVVEYQDRVAIHARMNGGDILRRQRLHQIDAIDLSRKAGPNLAD